jgi:hypothetical protein
LNFNVDPTFNDVKIYIAAASQSVSHWGELTITITSSSKTITITPVSGSIHYTQASVTINYTLPT